jgi:hypothetical protein
LTLEHPVSGELLSWQAEVPPDMAALLAVLRADARRHADDG